MRSNIYPQWQSFENSSQIMGTFIHKLCASLIPEFFICLHLIAQKLAGLFTLDCGIAVSRDYLVIWLLINNSGCGYLRIAQNQQLSVGCWLASSLTMIKFVVL